MSWLTWMTYHWFWVTSLWGTTVPFPSCACARTCLDLCLSFCLWVFIKFGTLTTKISSNIFYMPSSQSQPWGTPITCTVGCLRLPHRSLMLFSFHGWFFSGYFNLDNFYWYVFKFTNLFSVLCHLLLIECSVLFVLISRSLSFSYLLCLHLFEHVQYSFIIRVLTFFFENSNICVSSGSVRLIISLHILFSYPSAHLVIFDRMPDLVNWTLSGAEYFCIPLSLELCSGIQLNYLETDRSFQTSPFMIC